MQSSAHNVCYMRTFMESVLTNYEISLYFGGELIAISNVLKYTEGIDFFGCLSVSDIFPNAGMRAAPAERSGAELEGLVQGFGRSGLADPAGAEYAAAAGALPCRMLVGCGALGLAGMAVFARCGSGACRRGAELSGCSARNGWSVPNTKKIIGWASTPTSNGGSFYEIAAGIQKGAAAHRLRRVICTAVMGWCLQRCIWWAGSALTTGCCWAASSARPVAIGNFAGICFVVQKVIDEPDEKSEKRSCRYPIIQGCCCRRCGSS